MLPKVKERLVKYATTKGLKPYLFAEKNLLAPNTFANKSEISTDNLVKVFTNYPELNFDWVITGRGEMLLSENSKKCEDCTFWKEKYYDLLEKNSMLQEEQISYLKQTEIIINKQ
jgi:hypothetical protein